MCRWAKVIVSPCLRHLMVTCSCFVCCSSPGLVASSTSYFMETLTMRRQPTWQLNYNTKSAMMCLWQRSSRCDEAQSLMLHW